MDDAVVWRDHVWYERDVPALNGDGKLEIVVDSQYYEGSATTVYEITGATVTPVLAAGCGA